MPVVCRALAALLLVLEAGSKQTDQLSLCLFYCPREILASRFAQIIPIIFMLLESDDGLTFRARCRKFWPLDSHTSLVPNPHQSGMGLNLFLPVRVCKILTNFFPSEVLLTRWRYHWQHRGKPLQAVRGSHSHTSIAYFCLGTHTPLGALLHFAKSIHTPDLAE